MKKIILIGITVLLASCTSQTNKAGTTDSKNDSTAINTEKALSYYGDKITADSARPVSELVSMMNGNKEINVKLTGEVEGVCQKKGCWMDLKNQNGEKLHVTFKDYNFFVPKDCKGKTAYVDGKAMYEETSIDELKEIAKDAGKPKVEIDAIKEPKKQLVFEAKGVIIK